MSTVNWRKVSASAVSWRRSPHTGVMLTDRKGSKWRLGNFLPEASPRPRPPLSYPRAAISRWAITATTATTAATGAQYPNKMWWGADSLFTGRLAGIGALFVRPDHGVRE